MINAIVPIWKPINWTSFDVVKKIRNKIKPSKVGHAGTLDPFAEGVFVVRVRLVRILTIETLYPSPIGLPPCVIFPFTSKVIVESAKVIELKLENKIRKKQNITFIIDPITALKY